MRASAKIMELSLFIQRYLFSFRKVGKNFQFIRFVEAPHHFFGLLLCNLYAFQRKIRLDYIFHFFFDLLEIGNRYGRSKIEIVIKTVVCSRTYGELSRRIQIFDRLRKNVRGSMSVNLAPVFILKRQYFERAIFIDNRR